jgi:hypothetical protein
MLSHIIYGIYFLSNRAETFDLNVSLMAEANSAEFFFAYKHIHDLKNDFLKFKHIKSLKT